VSAATTGPEARDLAVASFGGVSKVWRQRQALEAVESSGDGEKLWMLW
jgi:hypothetical protein